VALEQAFARPQVRPTDRRSVLAAHRALDRAIEELNRHLVGTPGWWRDADTAVRRIADALLLAVELAPVHIEDEPFAFDEQPTAVFTRPHFEAAATLAR
jgi:hypothetical protein